MSKTNETVKTLKISPHKATLDPAGIELTQKIDVDYKEVVGQKGEKRNSAFGIKLKASSSASSSLTGKSFFTRKRVADDYVRSNTVLSTIESIPPLEDNLELQDIHTNYELKKQFSEGAQGEIWTAFDKSLKRDIVVKSLKKDEDKDCSKKDESLFVSEARIMAQLDHPSIIPLYGLHSEIDSKLHLAMKHIHGKTLKEYLQDIFILYEREGIESFDEKRSIATRIEYFLKICEAVEYAHCKGVIHRDLKPENIMIGNYGEVYVMDWGLACLTDPEKFSDDEHLSKAGMHSKNALVGTPCYIAPELIRGGECSPQSDIFSLGMILFEMVTLKKAVRGNNINEVLRNIANGNYRSFKHRFMKSKLPSDLKAIVAKAISDSLAQRYKSVADMANDLKLFLMSEETAARPDNIFRKSVRFLLNHKMMTSVVLLSILLCLSASTIYSLYSQNQLMKEQKIRENMLTNFQDRVSQSAGKMDQVFFYFNNQLVNLAYQAGRVLNHKADDMKIYTLMDFRGKNPPKDYALSPAYGIDISLDYPVLKRISNKKALDSLDKRVAVLSPMFKHMTFTSDPDFKNDTNDEIRKIIMEKGAPLNWITMGLKNGTMFAYPGTSVYPDNYDPRTRPWYKKALLEKNKTLWSEPFKCALSSKLLMSTTRSVYDENNVFLGVASLHIRLDYIKKYIFDNKEAGAKEYLIDKNGKVVLSSNFKNRRATVNEKSTKLVMDDFPFLKEFREAVGKDEVQFEVTKYNTKYIFGLNRLPSLGYYYIQQISEKRLRNAWYEKYSYKK
jgi:serine/threonine protein kinase